jgi:hypothetical protein
MLFITNLVAAVAVPVGNFRKQCLNATYRLTESTTPSFLKQMMEASDYKQPRQDFISEFSEPNLTALRSRAFLEKNSILVPSSIYLCSTTT